MIMRKIMLILVAPSAMKAQAQVFFEKTFGGSANDYGFCVQQCTDGGYIVVGKTNSYRAGGDDVYVIKTDANGDTP